MSTPEKPKRMTAVKFSRADEYVAELEAQRRAWAATNGPAVARNRDRTQAILLAEYRAELRRARESEERLRSDLRTLRVMLSVIAEWVAAARPGVPELGAIKPHIDEALTECERAIRDSGLEGEETDLPPIDSTPLETE